MFLRVVCVVCVLLAPAGAWWCRWRTTRLPRRTTHHVPQEKHHATFQERHTHHHQHTHPYTPRPQDTHTPRSHDTHTTPPKTHTQTPHPSRSTHTSCIPGKTHTTPPKSNTHTPRTGRSITLLLTFSVVKTRPWGFSFFGTFPAIIICYIVIDIFGGQARTMWVQLMNPRSFIN